MEKTFLDKIEEEEEIKNEIVQNILEKDLNIYRKDIYTSKFIHTEIRK